MQSCCTRQELRWATMATIDMDLKEGVLCCFRGALGTRLIHCGLRGSLLPYQVASSSIQPFGHNSVGCHSLHRNISTNYYFVVEMHTVTLLGSEAGSPSNTNSPGLRPTPYRVASWCIQPFRHNTNGQNIGDGGSALFAARGLGPHLTQSPCQVPASSLHPCSQDRTYRQRPIA